MRSLGAGEPVRPFGVDDAGVEVLSNWPNGEPDCEDPVADLEVVGIAQGRGVREGIAFHLDDRGGLIGAEPTTVPELAARRGTHDLDPLGVLDDVRCCEE